MTARCERRRAAYRDLSKWPRIVIPHLRSRAKRRGHEFTLEAADITVPKHCPVLGLELGVGDGRHADNSPSIDRWDNAKGYTPDNIFVISNRANQLKRDATPEEMRCVANYMENKPSPQ